MRHTLTLIIITVTFIYSCRQTTEEEKTIQFKLEQTNDITTLKLDSVTGFYQQLSFRADQINQSESTISFINRLNSSVYIYSATSGERLNTFKLERDGPEGIGDPIISSLLVHNLDSVFIYSPNMRSIFLFNREGKMMDKQVIMRFDDESIPIMPEPIGLSRMIKVENEIFLPSIFKRRLESYQNIPSITVYNINDKSVSVRYPYPAKYSEAHWGSTFKYNTSLAYITEKSEIVISYPIINDLYVYNTRQPENMTAQTAKSQWIDKFEPFKEDINEAIGNNSGSYWDDMSRHSLINSDFSGLLFNPFNKILYRFAYIRPSEQEYNSGNESANLAIAAFDKDYNKLAEILLENSKYQLSMIAFNKEGLLIARPDLFELDENTMPLELIKLIELSN